MLLKSIMPKKISSAVFIGRRKESNNYMFLLPLTNFVSFKVNSDMIKLILTQTNNLLGLLQSINSLISVVDWMIVFNVNFSNISVISWWSFLLGEETGIPGENH